MREVTQEERERFVYLLNTLAVAFNRNVNSELLQVYSRLLEEFTIDQLEQAGRMMLRDRTRKFFPVYSEFYAAIEGDPDARATQALTVLYNAMEKTGRYRNVAFKDHILLAVVEHLGDWIQVAAGVTDDQLSYWEHNFRRLYAQGCSERWQPSRPYLIGKCDAENLETSGTFERGKLPEPVVDVWDLDGTRTEVPLKLIAPKSQLVELYEADQKRLTEGAKAATEG